MRLSSDMEELPDALPRTQTPANTSAHSSSIAGCPWRMLTATWLYPALGSALVDGEFEF